MTHLIHADMFLLAVIGQREEEYLQLSLIITGGAE